LRLTLRLCGPQLCLGLYRKLPVGSIAQARP
jgi:hypothetical protein